MTGARPRPCQDVPSAFLLSPEALAGGRHLFAKASDVILLCRKYGDVKYGDVAEYVPVCELKQP